MKKILFIIMIALGFQMPALAQETQYEKPTWLFGVAAGANFNFYRGTTQRINADLMVPTAFHDGTGVGLFAAPLIEYRFPNSVWGIMLQAGYDNRQGEWDQVISPCDCPMDLSTDLSYITIEPSLRIAPFKNAFYLFTGPRLAFNLDKSFTYQKGTNPEYPEQIADPEVNADFSEVEDRLISMQVGAGFDIPLSSNKQRTQFVFSPFVAFHPYFGQNPRSVESWNITTIRAGAAIKFGMGRKRVIEEAEVVKPEFGFTVDSPQNVPGKSIISESFPLSNYIYFEKGSTEIPGRYKLLNKDEVKDFKEDQVAVKSPKDLSGRSKREMAVYYHVLNILGDRMGKNPNSTITLVGSSEKGPEDAKVMAGSVKTYLVDVFAINSSRIAVEGRTKPKVPSEKIGGKLELDLLREEDRRVTVESTSPELLMEFQSGPNAAMKAVQLKGIQEAPASSYVTFKTDGAKEAFSTWRLELTDDNGTVKNYGPYTEEEVSIPGKTILGNNTKGDFKVKMIGTAKDGEIMTKESNINVVLWTPSEVEEGIRFSIIYEFDDAKAIAMYEKYLTEIVAPKIPKNGKVVIQGHTDVIGDAENNQKLSMARANDVKRILEAALSRSNRKDVTFEVYGFGEDTVKSPFGNNLPEERSYNRTVVIDLLAGNKTL
ncbi:OmpA family protein [Salinimicrobium sp. TH3]|uniref:OmpA family protein n=1 Tax=Salinimicrobium sp. TH3 TaxID=2997342 RepID=UPI0022768779|nr:OmpA family protein [Salinimicrobium sp. TH3]MCY2686028.1 OmpA family protein [Salinimicrobium sp. TH3]